MQHHLSKFDLACARRDAAFEARRSAVRSHADGTVDRSAVDDAFAAHASACEVARRAALALLKQAGRLAGET